MCRMLRRTGARRVLLRTIVLSIQRQAAQLGPAIINGDGVVSVSDLLAVIVNWGSCPLPQPQMGCPGDVAPPPTGDDVVNVGDLLMVIDNWG